MRKLGRRSRLVVLVVGVFVLASLAVAAASGNLGGAGQNFQVDSAEPASTSQSTGEGRPAEPSPAPADSPAGSVVQPPGTPGSSTGPNSSSDPDSPVSSDDSSRPSPTTVTDPPSAFSGIRNFEQCAAAGYPVMESYPEQCRTPDGRLFVRVID